MKHMAVRIRAIIAAAGGFAAVLRLFVLRLFVLFGFVLNFLLRVGAVGLHIRNQRIERLSHRRARCHPTNQPTGGVKYGGAK